MVALRSIFHNSNCENIFPAVSKLFNFSPDGGIVTGPTLAMIGERGPEAVIPLSGRGGGMGNYTINITGGLGSSAEIGTAVVNAIRAFNRQNGPANIAVA